MTTLKFAEYEKTRRQFSYFLFYFQSYNYGIKLFLYVHNRSPWLAMNDNKRLMGNKKHI